MTKITLKQDIKIKKNLKDIPESSWNKIIFVDNKKLTERGYLLADILMDTLLNDNNPKLFLPAENRPSGTVRIANQQAAYDLIKVLDASGRNITMISNSIRTSFPIHTAWSIIFLTKRDFVTALTKSRRDTTTDNYTFINESLNLNIHTMRADNDFFTFIRSDDGSGFKRAKVKSLEVFQFLQKYAGDYAFEVVYPAGETFDENEVQDPGDKLIVTPDNPSTDNKGNRSYAIRLKKGAKIIESLEWFAKDRKIGFAEFSMIGSVEKIEVLFSLGGDEGYKQVEMPNSPGVGKTSLGQMELLSSWGNITWDHADRDKPIVHCHVSLADYEKLQAFGGHLKEATVSITAEIVLRVLSEDKVFKKLDNQTNVALWDFEGIKDQQVVDNDQMLVAQVQVPPKGNN